jgi:hypothetical protein
VNPREELRSMLTGFRISAALAVAAELGLSDHLAAGPCSVADLAGTVSADETTLLRLMRALATVGVYTELPDGRFANTPVGEGLLSDAPATMRPLARTLAEPEIWSSWGHLLHSVRTGENAFQALNGVDIWTHRLSRPEQNAVFNANMSAQSSMVAGAVAASYDFSGRSTVVDVGGGEGVLLEAVLAAHPQLTGTVFDQAHVVAQAPTSGATDSVAGRWSTASGSFFDSVPTADAYLLKSILHDWPDEECRQILATCRRSLNPGGVVLVVETVLGRPGYEVDAAFSDLNMLVLPGGQERTEQEYAALFAAAGLRLTRIVDTGTRFSIVEGSLSG